MIPQAAGTHFLFVCLFLACDGFWARNGLVLKRALIRSSEGVLLGVSCGGGAVAVVYGQCMGRADI